MTGPRTTGPSTWPWPSPRTAPATSSSWAGDGGEGAKCWLQVLTELENRGVTDALLVVCDGLKGLPDAIGQTWPLAVVQTCVIHLLRNSFRYASRQHHDAIAEALRPIYTAPIEATAKARFTEFTEDWGEKYLPSSGSGNTPDPSLCRSWPLRCRDQNSDLLDERDRIVEFPLPKGRPGPRAFPERRPL